MTHRWMFGALLALCFASGTRVVAFAQPRPTNPPRGVPVPTPGRLPGQPACTTGQSACLDATRGWMCVNLQRDEHHCGRCNNNCGNNYCQDGVCVPG